MFNFLIKPFLKEKIKVVKTLRPMKIATEKEKKIKEKNILTPQIAVEAIKKEKKVKQSKVKGTIIDIIIIDKSSITGDKITLIKTIINTDKTIIVIIRIGIQTMYTIRIKATTIDGIIIIVITKTNLLIIFRKINLRMKKILFKWNQIQIILKILNRNP